MSLRDISIHHAASFEPRKLVWSKHFLLGHRSRLWLWMPVTVLSLMYVFVVFFPEDPLLGDSTSPVWHLFTVGLYVAIFSLGLHGLWLVLFALAKTSVETELTRSIIRSVSNELRRIRNKEKQRIDLHEVDRLFPENTTEDLYILRLARNIVEDAKDRKFDSASVLMQPYKEESVSDLFRISVIQKTALQLGILGTFIGLIAAFAGLMHGDTGSESLLAKVIPALKYSFTTSVTGLQVAIVVSLFMVLVRKNQDRLFKHMEDAANALLALSRNAVNKDDFLAEFSQVSHSVKQLDDKVYTQTREVSLQTQVIAAGLDRLAEVDNRFNGFLNNLSDQERKFLAEIRSFHDALSLKDAGHDLKESMRQSVQGITDALNAGIAERIEKYTAMDKSTVKIHEALTKVTDALEKQQRMVERSAEAFGAAMSAIHQSQENFIGKITGTHFSDKIRQDFTQIGAEFSKTFGEQLKAVENRLSSQTHSMEEFNKRADRYFTFRLVLEKRALMIATAITVTLGVVLLYKNLQAL